MRYRSGTDVQVWVGLSGDNKYRVNVFNDKAEISTDDFDMSACEAGLEKLRDALDNALLQMRTQDTAEESDAA
jgi:hypothetical protein